MTKFVKGGFKEKNEKYHKEMKEYSNKIKEKRKIKMSVKRTKNA